VQEGAQERRQSENSQAARASAAVSLGGRCAATLQVIEWWALHGPSRVNLASFCGRGRGSRMRRQPSRVVEMPPSTGSVWMRAASSEASQATAWATSSGWTVRLAGVPTAIWSRRSPCVSLIGVRATGGQDAGVASAMVNTMQQVGGSVGTALLSTVAASATLSFARTHTGPGVQVLAAVHGFTTAFIVSGSIFVVGAVLTGVLLPSGVLHQPDSQHQSAPPRRP